MAYQRLSLGGYNTGSGQIENRCKHAGLRLKRPGADRSERGVTVGLALQGWLWPVDTADQTLCRRAA